MDDKLFPLTAKYDPKWVKQNSIGENVLHDLESLCEILDVKEGDRILDLGCGNAISSIFLAREFGAQVWAVDKWVSPTENYARIVESHVADLVFPLRADAHALPFPHEFFDAVIAIDSYLYFGTDDRYLPYLGQFIKPDGLIGVVDTCFKHEINSPAEVPDFLKPSYADHWYYVHSVEWWKNQWRKTGLVDVLRAETLPQSDFILQEFIDDHKDIEEEKPIIDVLLADKEGFISIFRAVAQRTGHKLYLEDFEQV